MLELDAVREAGLIPNAQDMIPDYFDRDYLAGGPYNITLVTVPLGDPETKESNYVSGFHQVEIKNDGNEVQVTLLAIDPSGRRRLIPMLFDTGLADLKARADAAADPDEKLSQRVRWQTRWRSKALRKSAAKI